MSELDFNVQLIRRIEALERQLSKTASQDPLSPVFTVPGLFAGIPGIHGAWNFVDRNLSAQAIDLSNQGMDLSNTANPAVSINTYLAAIATFNGTTQYFGRTLNTDFAFTSTITMGIWVFPASIAATNFFGKTGASGQFGYGLQFDGTTGRFYVSSNGTAVTSVISTVPLATSKNWCIVGRYIPSTEMAIWINGVKVVNTTSIPASVFNNTAVFQVGAASGNAQFYNGVASYPWISSEAVPDRMIDLYFQALRPMFLI